MKVGLLVGRTAVLIGMNVEPKTAQREYDRAQHHLSLDHDTAVAIPHDARIGLMTSNPAAPRSCPLHGKALSMRAQWKVTPPLLDKLMVQCQVIRSLKKHRERILETHTRRSSNSFLDNRPNGILLSRNWSRT